MESCEVLIVGGGPAGSSCAWRLKRAGVDVLVLDKSAFPRDKVCAGWVTPQVIETLQIDTADYRNGRTFQPITGFATGLIDPNTVDTLYDRPVSYGIRRCEFDHYLLQRSGARLVVGALKTMVRDGDRWRINDTLEARMVVGAGGHFCPVARALGAQLGRDEQVVAAQEIEFEMNARQAAACGVEPDKPELYFCPDLKGYGWCFRKGNFLNVGLGREDNHKLAEHVEAFCDFLKHERKVPEDIGTRFKGHAYLLYNHAPRKVVAEAALLIGDAAGLAYAQSGEGIRPAIESALMAADIIVGAAGDYHLETLAPYERKLVERFGAREGNSAVSDFLPHKLKMLIAGRLMKSRWFARNVVLDRWFLHAQLPALAAG